MKYIKIFNDTTQIKNPLRAKYCASFFCQLRGLMFTKSLAVDEGLLLVQNNDSRVNSSIHMMFMSIDLAVVWINSKFIVVDKVLARRWKLGYLPKRPAKFVLETGVLHLAEYNIGDNVHFQESS